jgi:lipoprotein signal peptidase
VRHVGASLGVFGTTAGRARCALFFGIAAAVVVVDQVVKAWVVAFDLVIKMNSCGAQIYDIMIYKL